MEEVMLSFCFVVVLYLFITTHLCYATYTDNNKFFNFPENVEVENLLNSLNKPPVKSIKSPDGDIIDCVHVSHQPAFDHPLLKNHTIKKRPSYHPNLINLDDTKVSSEMNVSKVGPSSSSISQLWHSNGKCPKGTIPIRRTKKEDVLRANSVESYGKKSSYFARQSFIGGPPPSHEYAIAYTKGEFYGSKAALNLWNPSVQKDANEFSLTQTWIRGGTYDSGLNTIEAGWQVYPKMYGDTNTRLFIYWTGDAYKNTGCYNLLCPGFVQTNNKIAIGGSMSPTSQIDGTQYGITILIWKDGNSGNWWLKYDEEVIGYWPSSLFTYLRESASEVQWGGEVVNLESQGRHTTTQMGSGQFPNQGFRKASYVRKVETVDQSNNLRTAVINTLHKPGCYDILTRINNDNYWGTHFFYGGPGQNINCP